MGKRSKILEKINFRKVIFKLSDEDERAQKNTFTRWVNYHLEEVRVTILVIRYQSVIILIAFFLQNTWHLLLLIQLTLMDYYKNWTLGTNRFSVCNLTGLDHQNTQKKSIKRLNCLI